MITRNPKIDGSATSVQSLLRAMKKSDPQEYRVEGRIQVPDWRGVNNHFQGIAPINGEASITGDISASADRAWVANFLQGTSSPSEVQGVWSTQNYDHAGGIQRLGELLVVPLESDNGATIAFLQGSTYLYEIHQPDGHKASAAAITNYTDSAGVEQALLMVYRYDPKSFDIFRAPADSVSSNTWERVGGSSEISGREQYQCFALVTQTSTAGVEDNVYLVGLREDETVVLFSLVTLGSFFGSLAELEQYKFDGSQWRYGVGLQIVSPTSIRIFGCSEDPSGDRDDYHFPIYVWG
jgi:hypothetical protein